MNQKLTLNLGLRYDYQTLTPNTKNAFAPRLGFAYDPTGAGRTVIRGGVGKFYEYHLVGIGDQPRAARRLRPGLHVRHGRGSRPPTAASSPSTADRLPAADRRQRAGGHQPGMPRVSDRPPELAAAGCGRAVHQHRAADRWRPAHGLSLVVQPRREARAHAESRRRRRLRRQPRPRSDARRSTSTKGRSAPTAASPGSAPAGFDPSGTLIPAAARNANFQRVLQYQTRDDLNSDFDSLELSLEKRYSQPLERPRRVHARLRQRRRRRGSPTI